MAEKIKLNKNSLREQNQSLKLYLEFLPTLELRKQQLQKEVREAKMEIKEAREDFSILINEAKTWGGRLENSTELVKSILKIKSIDSETKNIAGVKVPVLKKVNFNKRAYSLVATSWILDSAINFFQEAVFQKESIKFLQQKFDLINKELTKTTQRINLYEKVLIPETKENIRKIKVYLGDQQTAAVCRAKIAKTKLVAKALKSGA
jgi:V/A-type H+/Na+-transporting ATPase subunit D